MYLGSSVANFGEKTFAKPGNLLKSLTKTSSALNRLFEPSLKGVSHHLGLYQELLHVLQRFHIPG